MTQAATALATELKSSDAQAAAWAQALHFPCEIAVSLTVPGFTIANLLRLRPQLVVNTSWSLESDVPLRVNGELIAWAEFEVVGDQLAVRITELA